MKALMALFVVFGLSLQVFATDSKKKNLRKPNQEAQECVKFTGSGAKKTFMALYPFTQGKVTAITAEETRTGETDIATANIFCRVFTTGLDASTYGASLKKMSDDKFQCGYFISSEGDLTACSDPM